MTEPDIYDLAAQAEQCGTAGQDDSRQETDEEPAYPHYTAKEFRTRAYNGETPDENLPMPDRIFFWALRDMYQRFKAGKITKEQGDSERKTAEKLYRRDRAKYDLYTSTVQNITSFWKRVEAAATDYAKSNGRTPEADALFEAVYKAIPK